MIGKCMACSATQNCWRGSASVCTALRIIFDRTGGGARGDEAQEVGGGQRRVRQPRGGREGPAGGTSPCWTPNRVLARAPATPPIILDGTTTAGPTPAVRCLPAAFDPVKPRQTLTADLTAFRMAQAAHYLEELTVTAKEGKLKGFELVKMVHLDDEQFSIEV